MEKVFSALCINDVLPHHLLTEVLIRIPSIDLLRCKTVCKLWLSLLDKDTDFVRQFLLQRVRERSRLNGDEEDKQPIHVRWDSTEMVTMTPAWYCADASKFSLDFLPIFDGLHFGNQDLCDIVLGSSNGLLLCTSDRTYAGSYYICNPITKQWLELPPYPPRPGDSNEYVKVGFISDPFYNINDDDHSITVNNDFGVKVIRLDCSRYNLDEDEDVREIDVEVFSSQTGCWTTSKVQLPDHVEGELEFLYRGVIAPYNGKIYWILQDEREFLIYDISKNEFLMNRLDLPSNALRYEHGEISPFIWISLCQESLWMAQALKWQLRVYMLVDDDQWCLKHDVDILNDMEWGPVLSLLREYLIGADNDYIAFYSMHPSDPMVGYVATDHVLLKCNFQSRTHDEQNAESLKNPPKKRNFVPQFIFFVPPFHSSPPSEEIEESEDFLYRIFLPGSISVEKSSVLLCINDVLPHQLLTEVMIRIPSVDLFRCKTVCKLWLSLLDDDTDFVRQFVLQRVKERSRLNGDEEYKQPIHVKWDSNEMVMVTPSWYCADASKFSLDFLPFSDDLHFENPDLFDIVLGSSNGLLLCTSDRTFGESYYICNPITKQWLELPPYPPRHDTRAHNDNQYVKVCFISDPFYNINDDDHSITMNNDFGVKVIRLDSSRYNEDVYEEVREIDVEVFSSKTGCWTTSKVRLPDHVKGELEFLYRGVIAPYNGKIYWLVEDKREFLIYDINKNEFLMNSIDPPSSAFLYRHGVIASFIGISLCQGSLWMAQGLEWKLRVYMLVDDDQWCLKHDVDILNDMEWDFGSQHEYVIGADNGHLEFYRMHPSDPMMGYLGTEHVLLECNFRSRTDVTGFLVCSRWQSELHKGALCRYDCSSHMLIPTLFVGSVFSDVKLNLIGVQCEDLCG
ncbi:Putative F-box/kelch-repeat protein At1g15680 [Linum perenne]